jgi:tetratricopeptide (TPR) repeat protein
MNQQLFEKALKAFEQASALDPKLVIARVNQGIALVNLQRVDAATQSLQEAARQQPKDPYAWYNLGMLYKNSGDPQAATEAFKKVTETDPEDADSWYMLGSAYLQAKQFPQAEEAFRHALQINPLHASAEFGLSRALQESGDMPQARSHLVRFQYITKNKLGAPMSLAYGEQGKYSRAEESPAVALKVPPPIAVTFVNATEKAALPTRTSESQAAGHDLGPGACFLDYDGDGLLDILLPGENGRIALYHNVGKGRFEDVTARAGLSVKGFAVSCAAADYDNDGATDVALGFEGSPLLRLFHNEKNGTFRDVTEQAGITVPNDLKTASDWPGLLFIDYDHDGDVDLYFTADISPPLWSEEPPAASSPQPLNRMWRNNGDGTFTDVTDAIGLRGSLSTLSAIGTDYNNDRAVDLLLTGEKESPIIYENPREGAFPARRPWSGEMPASSVGAAPLDFNHDGWMDIAFTHWAPPGVSLWKNVQGKSFERVSLPPTEWIHAFGIAAFDYDNDGWVDIAAVGETKAGKDEIKLFRNMGPDGFKDVTAEVGLDKIALKNPRALITGDYDGDGATDLLVTQNHGPAALLRNEGGNKNHWLRLSLKGLNDNKSAIGTKVEVFAGGNRQKWEIAGSSGYLGQNSTEIIAGLGQATQADVVRMLWPTGVLQDEIEVAADQHKNYLEIDRRGSSCPTLFAWDGQRYALVADMIGAAAIGHWVAPGQRNIPRPTEYIKLDRSSLREKNGKLSFRFIEPLEEAVYLDQVLLLAVDHPADVSVYPNEYFASNPPYPPFKVVFSRNPQPPAAAWDDHGHNLLPDLLAHRFVGDFESLPFTGFTKLHTLELDLGEPYASGTLWLLMHGEIEYFTATGMYAANQAGVQPIAPYVEALTSDGKWKRIIDDLGFPAGGPRTMTANLTGKLPAGTRRIRIRTNLQIYWDNILIDRSDQNGPARIAQVPLVRADLRFHGFPLKIEDRPPGNIKYIYEKTSATGPYTHAAGAYTRYGDVLPLLSNFDDRLAIFASGDEVALEFEPSRLPEVPPGWVRDYFFGAHGYEKDMDFYAYEPTTVAPLPFRDMGTYPYPRKSYPLTARRLKDWLEYDTRFMSGNEPVGFWFNYADRQ